MAQTQLDVTCVKITQPIGTFYVGKLRARDLVAYVSILRRGLSHEEQQHIQRSLSNSRQREIAAYVSDPDATFPTSIIVSVYGNAVTVDEAHNVLHFDFDGKLGELIDGQHRLEGLTLAAQKNEALLDEFEMPVVFMIDLSPDEKGYVFSIINSKQIQVPSSLIVDLLGLQVTRSPKKTCHEIAQTLNARPGSPFYRGIKMLGKKTFDSEYLTQGSFVKYLVELLSSDPDEDARREKRRVSLESDARLPFREFYRAGEDGVIAKILQNYFLAIAELYPHAWFEAPKQYLLRKTVGFAALMKVLEKVWPTASQANDASRSAFVRLLQPVRAIYDDDRFRSGNYASSGQGVNQMATDILRAIGSGGADQSLAAEPIVQPSASTTDGDDQNDAMRTQ